ncbi:kynurenine formamidase-like [Argonauta hians]
MQVSDKWKSLDAEALQHQYSPSLSTHRMSPSQVVPFYIKFLEEKSEETRRCVEGEFGINIGEAERHKMDIFGQKSAAKEAPIMVYIHGGYWQLLSREVSAFFVSPIVKAGGILCAVGYSIAPHGTMEQMIKEVKQTVSYVLKLAQERGSSGVYLCGHSAGAHLTAMMLTVDWNKEEEGVDSSLLKGVFLLSGIYDVRPIIHTHINDPLHMTEEFAQQISPAFLTEKIVEFNLAQTIRMYVGQHESEEFHRQGKDFCQYLKTAGIDVTHNIVPDTDHFSLTEKLAEDDYCITKEMVKMMGLSG